MGYGLSMIGTITKKIQPDIICNQMEEYTTYEIIVCWGVAGVPWIGEQASRSYN